MQLTDIEKEELFNEFMVKIAEMSKEDRKIGVAKNNHALKGVTKYYYDRFDPRNPKLKNDPTLFVDTGDPVEGVIYRFYGIYTAYLKLRAAVPAVVMVKKHANKSHSYKEMHRNPEFGDNPYLEDEDVEEATKVGKILLDAMLGYLLEDESNEKQA